MPKCVSMHDMNNTVKSTELVRSKDGPVTVTHNRAGALVVYVNKVLGKPTAPACKGQSSCT